MNRTTSIVFVALLASSVLAVLPPADASHQDAPDGVTSKAGFVGLNRMDVGLHSDDDDQDGNIGDADDYPEIYGLGAIGVVHLNDLSISTQGTAVVTVTSAVDPSGEVITLTRDDAASQCNAAVGCHYYGTFGVESDNAVAGNGRVAVSSVAGAQNILTVKYGTETSTSKLEWKPSSTATISFTQSLYQGTGVMGVVLVADADRNFRPGVVDTISPSLSLKVTSDSDPEGEWVQLTETDINSGLFEGTFPFQKVGTGLCASVGQEAPEATFDAEPVCVRDGDRLNATYFDLVDVRGHPYPIDNGTSNPPKAATLRNATSSRWEQPHTGSLQFMEPDFVRPIVSPFVNLTVTPKGYVRYEDPDLGPRVGSPAVPFVTAIVRSSVDTFGVPVRLYKMGDGEFRGDFNFTTNGNSISNEVGGSTLAVAPGPGAGTEHFVVGYIEDTINAAGVQQILQTNAPTSAVVQFMTGGCATPATSVSSNVHSIDICVSGPTPSDTTTVHVFSGRDLVGVRVDLNLAGANGFSKRGIIKFDQPQPAATFTEPCPTPPTTTCLPGSSATVTRAPRNPGSSDGVGDDTILVRKGDIIGALYLVPGITGDGVPAFVGDYVQLDRTTVAPAGGRGTLRFTNADFGETVTGYVNGLNDGAATEAAYVEINDTVRNANPAAIETFQVWLGNGSRPIAWSTDGENMTGPSFNVTETSASSGIFRGSFNLTLVPGPNGTSVDPAGDMVTAAYSYANAPSNCRPGGNNTACADDVGRGVVFNQVQFHNSTTTAVRFRDQARESSPLPAVTAQECPLLTGDTNPQAYPKCYHGIGRGYVYVPGIFRRPIDSTTGLDVAQVIVSAGNQSISVDVTERYMHSVEATGYGLPCQGLAPVPRPVILTGVAAVHQTCDDGYLGSFLFTKNGATSDANDILQVTDGVAVTVEFATNAELRPDLKKDVARWREAFDATVGTQQPLYRGTPGSATSPAASRIVTVDDLDRNIDSARIDNVTINITSDSDRVGFRLQLNETTTSSGRFQASFDFVKGASQYDTGNRNGANTYGAINVTDNDQVTFRYDEPFDASGEPRTRLHNVRWFEENAGVVAFTTAAYTGISAVATVRVSECPTAPTNCMISNNTFLSSSIRDVLPVRVMSDSDPVGEILTLTETTVDSGIFESTVGFEQVLGPNNGKVRVATGDRITAYYVDKDYNATQLDDPKARVATAAWAASADLPPTASMTASPSTGVAPLLVTFNITASDPEGSLTQYTMDFGDGSAATVAPGAPPPSITHVYNAGTFLPTLTVRDAAGFTATATATVTVTSPDTTAPAAPTNLVVVAGNTTANSAKLRWTAPGDDGATGNVSQYRVRVSTGSISTSNFETIVNPANVTFTFIPATLVAAGAAQEVLVAGLDASTTYNFAIRAVDEANNAGPISAVVSATTTGSDTTPPVGNLTITSLTHPENTNTTVNDATFSWSGLTDAESTITYRYVLNSVANFVVGPTDGTATATTSASFADLAAGSYVFHVRGFSGGGSSATAHYPITVIANTTPPDANVTPADVTEANLGIRVTVARVGVNNVVTWTLPPDPPATIAGFQVWRSTSPFVLVSDVPAGTSAFTSRTFTDPGAPAAARYHVTAYYAKTPASGYSATGSSSDIAGFDSLGPGSASPASTSNSDTGGAGGGSEGVSPWVWLAVAIAAALLIALVVLAIVLPRRRNAAEGEEPESDAQAARQDDVEWGR